MLSIKDKEKALVFSSSKLDYLFEKCVEQATGIFFKGERAYFDSEEINQLLNLYSIKTIASGNLRQSSVFKIIASCLLVSRSGFNQIWEHYEYPFLFFVGSGITDNEVFNRLSQNALLEDTLNGLKNTYVFYRSFEQDVLWIQKSKDAIFPVQPL